MAVWGEDNSKLVKVINGWLSRKGFYKKSLIAFRLETKVISVIKTNWTHFIPLLLFILFKFTLLWKLETVECVHILYRKSRKYTVDESYTALTRNYKPIEALVGTSRRYRPQKSFDRVMRTMARSLKDQSPLLHDIAPNKSRKKYKHSYDIIRHNDPILYEHTRPSVPYESLQPSAIDLRDSNDEIHITSSHDYHCLTNYGVEEVDDLVDYSSSVSIVSVESEVYSHSSLNATSITVKQEERRQRGDNSPIITADKHGLRCRNGRLIAG